MISGEPGEYSGPVSRVPLPLKRIAGKGSFLFVIGLTVTVPFVRQPGIHRLLFSKEYEPRLIRNDELMIRAEQAQIIDAAQSLLKSPSDTPNEVFIAPALPGLYYVLANRCPVWDNYPIWPGSTHDQNQMIRDLEASYVRWAIIGTQKVGGLSFSESHPRAWSYLQKHFERVEPTAFPPSVVLLRRVHCEPPEPTGNSLYISDLNIMIGNSQTRSPLRIGKPMQPSDPGD
jgi:hypothetical protein